MLEEIKLIEEDDQALIIGEVGKAAYLRSIEEAIIRFLKCDQYHANFGAKTKRNGREKCLHHRVAHQPAIGFTPLCSVARHLEHPADCLKNDPGLGICTLGYPCW